MKTINRRQFLCSTAAVAGMASAPCIVPSFAVLPSERITVAIIGRGLMGSGHLHRMVGDAGVQVLAVCDVDKTRRDEGKRIVEERYASQRSSSTYKGCAANNDYRDVLSRPEIDAVLIATPDHWHSLISIEAARAGKDVYCEKPVSINIHEGRELANAVRRYSRIFQTGTQYRSAPTIRQVCAFVRKGGLGKIKSIFTQWHSLGMFMGGRLEPYRNQLDVSKFSASLYPQHINLPEEPVPAGLDWNLWQGPAPWHPYNHLYHTNPAPGVVPWSFCDDFGVASSTWFQSHAADVLQYAVGVETSGPVEIIHPSSGTYPTLTFKYANGMLMHHIEHWGQVKELYHAVPADARLDGMFGGLIIGERGWVTTMSNGGPIQASPESLFAEMNLTSRQVNIGANNHHANWLECIRTRRQPSAHEEIGHRSASLGHLAIIGYRLGRSLQWNPESEEFINDDQANRLRKRAMRDPWQI